MAIFIALGANIGEKRKTMLSALEKLTRRGVKILRVSDFIITQPYGVTDQPEFLNAVAEVATKLSPPELLRVLLSIENELGRVRLRRWGERNIDLDLLLYDDIVMRSAELTLPHPDMQNRDFVLRPLAQIAPQIVHPLLRKTVLQLLEELDKRNNVL